MEFTSLQLLILVFMYVFHLGPWVFVSSQGKSLAEVYRTGRFGAAFPGEGLAGGEGFVGVKERGDRGAPYGGLGWVGGGREVGRRRCTGAAAMGARLRRARVR